MSEMVSVVVAVHDVEDLVDRCVESVRRQTHANLEIILVDDGSRDTSGARCDAHAAVDARVRVLHRANGGLSAARNSGLGAATGTRVLFVDGDDWVHEDLVRSLLVLVDGRPRDIAVCSFLRTSVLVADEDESNAQVRHLDRDDAVRAWAGADHTVLTTSWGQLVPRDFFDKVTFPVGRLHEDEFTSHLLLYQAERVHLLGARLYYYWQRPDSIMGSGYSVRRGLDAVAAGREQIAFLERVELSDTAGHVRVQLLKDLARLHLRLSESTDESLRSEVRHDLVEVAREVRHGRHSRSARAFAALCASLPDVAARLHDAYRTSRQPRQGHLS